MASSSMLHSLFEGMELQTNLMLLFLLIFLLIYEAINGFHDTANSVATVIYTRAMRAQLAVVMSGAFNFLGVLMGGLSVAYTIVHLLPNELLLNASSSQGLAMIFSMLLAAILWNLGTWYVGLPASSSHTLIGTIIGIGLTNALITKNSLLQALNISKLTEIILSLTISPLIGFIVAGSIVFLLRRYWNNTKKRRRIHLTPAKREEQNAKRKPPFWTRIALILSAAGVSFSHGANDGQKGIGLIMLVLISAAPASFVVNMQASGYDINRTRDAVKYLQQYYMKNQNSFNHLLGTKEQTATLLETTNAQVTEQNNNDYKLNQKKIAIPEEFHCNLYLALTTINHSSLLGNLQSYKQLNSDQRSYVRRLLICIAKTTEKILKVPGISAEDKRFLGNLRKDILYTIEYAPLWIIVAVALALSLGTMIGWRRVTITIGEKIGKKSMTYAQGLAAQMTAAISIGIASYIGMPVSTTHVLSSAVTGAMLVDGGGVQSKTVKNILMAWVLTLPFSIMLSGSLYWLILQLI